MSFDIAFWKLDKSSRWESFGAISQTELCVIAYNRQGTHTNEAILKTSSFGSRMEAVGFGVSGLGAGLSVLELADGGASSRTRNFGICTVGAVMSAGSVPGLGECSVMVGRDDCVV